MDVGDQRASKDHSIKQYMVNIMQIIQAGNDLRVQGKEANMVGVLKIYLKG